MQNSESFGRSCGHCASFGPAKEKRMSAPLNLLFTLLTHYYLCPDNESILLQNVLGLLANIPLADVQLINPQDVDFFLALVKRRGAPT
jgi:enoyl reductase-like protein